MSNVARLRELSPAPCQLPVAWYFDPAIFELEKKLLFDAGANYVGHELMVSNVGDYYTLEWMDHAKMLVRNASGVELLSNVCRHRQAIMLEGRGNAENIVCPLHRWTYDLKGELLTAPHFPRSPCVKLHSTPLTRGQRAGARLALGKLLSRRQVRVVSERAGGVQPGPALADAHDRQRRVLLPRRDRLCRAQLRRGAAGRLRRDRARGQGDLRAPQS